MRNGKVALVTGSSTGIGAACAVALAKAGYDVAVHYSRSKDQAALVEQQVREHGVNSCILCGDTSLAETPERLVRETVEKLGRLDVLVNNAGVTIMEPVRDFTLDTFTTLYNLNYRGMLLGAKAAAQYMVENGVKGSIIFNTSIRGFAPHSNDGAYGGLKAGLNRTIQSFAMDLGRYGIRVNAFSPGVTNVRATDPQDEQESPMYRYAPRFIPLRRNGYAEDMGKAVVFLASDKASYITGQVLCVDGGLSIVGGPENMPDLYNAFDVADIMDAQGFDVEEFRAMNRAYYQKIRERKDVQDAARLAEAGESKE